MSATRFRETWRDALRAVNRRPGEGVKANVAHHGFRILVLIAIALLVPLLYPREPLPEAVALEEGEVASEDVIADFAVTVRKPADQLTAEREEAERSVVPIYALDPGAADSAEAMVTAFFRMADEAFAGGSANGIDTAAEESFAEAYGLSLNEGQRSYLRQAGNRQALEASLKTAYRRILPRGVASVLDLGSLASTRVLVRSPGQDRFVSRDSLMTVGRFLQDALTYAPDDASIDGFQLYQNLLVRFTVPSLRSDDVSTVAAREQARAAVDTVLGTILEGERIISAHERVGVRDIVRLRAYNAELARRGLAGAGGRRLSSAGSVLYVLLLLGLYGAVLHFFRPELYADARGYLIVMGLVALVIAAASVIAANGYAPELIPIALLALLMGALYDGLVAVIAVLITAALLGGVGPVTAGEAARVPFLMLAAGAAAGLGVRGVRRRSHSWVLIALITGAYILAGTAVALIDAAPARTVLSTAGWGLVSATVWTVLAIGAFVPALEKLTGISTDQTLLELSDLNAPVLRELSRKAPGTYAHSINVANLAEATCATIGANPLRVRAGVYYHDIGKMVNPQYFVENQPKGRNPHDRLPPARSAAIIRDHVREGLRLAAEHRLPPVVGDFIREHHGTSVISFFLDKARSEDPGLELDPNDFAYPGPKPQSKETAVVMLADGVESATRVLQDPTPDRIRRTIDQIVEARIEGKQLDQSPLTLRELDVVKAEFARVLIGMYHRRIEYPSGVRAREELRPAPGAPPGTVESGSVAPPALEESSPDRDETASGPAPDSDTLTQRD